MDDFPLMKATCGTTRGARLLVPSELIPKRMSAGRSSVLGAMGTVAPMMVLMPTEGRQRSCMRCPPERSSV